MTAGLFAVTERDGGVVSLRIATDTEPYLGPSWVDSFATALTELGGAADVRAVVLEGGERHFSAGASRTALLDASDDEMPQDYATRAAYALLTLPIPVIAAAGGHAVGGGLLLALWCDVAVLAEESLYGANFMALGFTPGMGATHMVREAFGEPLGRELLFSGRLITGREIKRSCCPLSNAVRPRAEVLDRAVSLGREIADAPRAAVALLKRNLAEARIDALERAAITERRAHAELFADPATRLNIAERHPARAAPGSNEAT